MSDTSSPNYGLDAIASTGDETTETETETESEMSHQKNTPSLMSPNSIFKSFDEIFITVDDDDDDDGAGINNINYNHDARRQRRKKRKSMELKPQPLAIQQSTVRGFSKNTFEFGDGAADGAPGTQADQFKVCIGDMVKIEIANKKENHHNHNHNQNRTETGTFSSEGRVCYIGKPFRKHGIRYGIQLQTSNGDHNGTLHFDPRQNIYFNDDNEQCTHTRTYFQCAKHHGMFVKRSNIIALTRKLNAKKRLTVDDYVSINLRGNGYIKFIGILEHIKNDGIWYGIELNETKGRHDGKIQGIHYFKCKPQRGFHCRASVIEICDKSQMKSHHSIRSPNRRAMRQRFSVSHIDMLENTWIYDQILGVQNNKKKKNKISDHDINVSTNGQKKDNYQSILDEKIESMEKLVQQTNDNSSASASTSTTTKKRRRRQRHHRKTSSLDSRASVATFMSTKALPMTQSPAAAVPATDTDSELSSFASTTPRQQHVYSNGTNTGHSAGKGSGSKRNSMRQQSMPYILPHTMTGDAARARSSRMAFAECYAFDDIEDEIGNGQFGVVYKCRPIAPRMRSLGGAHDDDDDLAGLGMPAQLMTTPSMLASPQTTTENMNLRKQSVNMFDDLDYGLGSDSDSFQFPGDNVNGAFIPSDDEVNLEAAESDSEIYPYDVLEIASAASFDVGNDDGQNDDHGNTSSADENVFAVKKISKSKFGHLGYIQKSENVAQLKNEIELLNNINRYKKGCDPTSIALRGSEYVIRLIDVFEDRNFMYIVTNYCSGGNLWKLIDDFNASTSGNPERSNSLETTMPGNITPETKVIMREILEGISFLHRNDIAHLDLKPDNIVFDYFENESNHVQLIDFGMSQIIGRLTKKRNLAGTAHFVAPEVINGYYDKQADIWSAGIIFFMLQYGFPPFFVSDAMETVKDESKLGDLDTDDALFDKIEDGFEPVVKPGSGAWFPAKFDVSLEFRQLLAIMLCSNIAERATANECLEHPFFTNDPAINHHHHDSNASADANELSAELLPPTVVNAFAQFDTCCRFRLLISRYFTFEIKPHETQNLQRFWQLFSKDNEGKIALPEFDRVVAQFYNKAHNWQPYQIEEIFNTLDWNESEFIGFADILTAYSYQRLIAVDERLYRAFKMLDMDNDGEITQEEIKSMLVDNNHHVTQNYVELRSSSSEMLAQQRQPQAFRKMSGGRSLNSMRRGSFLSLSQRKQELLINNCVLSADWNDSGSIDYEEFLRSLHPNFNESAVTPTLTLSDAMFTFPDNSSTNNNDSALTSVEYDSSFVESSNSNIHVNHNASIVQTPNMTHRKARVSVNVTD